LPYGSNLLVIPLHTTENIVARFEEIVSNFENYSIRKQLFNIAVQVFKPDDVVRLIKDLKQLCLSTVTNILNIDNFCSINI